ncbi:MAG: adenine phosphoribosyltransferase [Candidatus Binatia bacterium]|nr:MAG: adenine phosphoribosyltransferase [Candidatus Binatia bacterium]
MTVEELRRFIREIPDFPKPGIVFKDITPLLADGPAFAFAVDRISERYRGKVDKVLGIESRGFILGAAVAYALRCGFAIVRKAGKLPHETLRASYELEYGVDSLEIHRDALHPPERVLVVDDLLATGGTARATVELVEKLGSRVVECAFLVELGALGGRRKLEPVPVFSLVRYEK